MQTEPEEARGPEHRPRQARVADARDRVGSRRILGHLLMGSVDIAGDRRAPEVVRAGRDRLPKAANGAAVGGVPCRPTCGVR